MYERMHDHREVYKEALNQLQNVKAPTLKGETVRISVKYEMDFEEVIYILTFEALFNADFDTDVPKFVSWSYNNRLDKMEVFPK